MSGPLDELRAALLAAPTDIEKLGIIAALDAYEAAHPGLRDHTKYCAPCGAPLGQSHHTAHGLFSDEELFATVFGTDHDAYDRLYCISLCDRCFRAMKAEREWHAADVRPLVDRLDRCES